MPPRPGSCKSGTATTPKRMARTSPRVLSATSESRPCPKTNDGAIPRGRTNTRWRHSSSRETTRRKPLRWDSRIGTEPRDSTAITTVRSAERPPVNASRSRCGSRPTNSSRSSHPGPEAPTSVPSSESTPGTASSGRSSAGSKRTIPGKPRFNAPSNASTAHDTS